MLDIAGGILIAIAVIIGGLVALYVVLKVVYDLRNGWDEAWESARRHSLETRAQAGDASAYCDLADMLSFTQQEERLVLYRNAAEGGHPEGQYRLACMLAERPGANVNEVGLWFASAALQGHSQAQCRLAELHVSGKGMVRDFVLAHAWFALASMTGDTYAIMRRDQIGAKLTADQLERSARFVASKAGAHKASGQKRAA